MKKLLINSVKNSYDFILENNYYYLVNNLMSFVEYIVNNFELSDNEKLILGVIYQHLLYIYNKNKE